MHILISPAKTMELHPCQKSARLPHFMQEADQIMRKLQSLSLAEAQKIWKCSPALAEQNYTTLQAANIFEAQSPALLSYAGAQYKSLKAESLSEEAWQYLDTHLSIISGLYGLVRPRDVVIAYRLEMQSVLSVQGMRNLYAFWGDKLAKRVEEQSRTVLNLASKEYFKCFEKTFSASVRCVTCVFATEKDGKIKEQSMSAKKARGAMVRFLAEKQACKPEDALSFAELGFSYQPQLSTGTKYVFVS